MILPETDHEEAERLVQSLRRKTKGGFPAKMGVTSYPEDAPDAERLISMARAACSHDGATHSQIPGT